MTVPQAKAILAAVRADQPDTTGDANIRMAISLAATNPDLAAWWAGEQNFDRAFGRKLTSLEPPVELQETIMRGAATIYLARRLVAETTGRLPGEKAMPPPGFDLDAAEEKISTFPDDAALAKKTSRLQPGGSAWRRSLPISVAASFALALLGLSLFFKTQNLTADSNQELPDFAQYAAALAGGGVPPVQRSANLRDLQNYLDSNQAPDPPAWPARLSKAEPVGVSVQDWPSRAGTHRVSYFVMQNGADKIHLFVLMLDQFPNDPVASDPVITSQGAYTVTTWCEGPHIFVLLSSTSIKQ